MKKTKLLSAVMSCIMTVSVAGSLVTSAEERSEGLISPYSENGNYTFEYLSAISKESFFALEGAEECYNSVFSDINSLRMKFFAFVADTYSNDRYEWYKSEKEITCLFANVEGFEMTSPIQDSTTRYNNFIFIANNQVEFPQILNEEDLESLTEEDYLYYAKALFCLNQVTDFVFLNGRAWNQSEFARGDANADEKFNIRDAAEIARKLANDQAEDLPDTADFNNDGKKDVRDCAGIAQFMSIKGIAKSDEFIK